jgi:hypothetical protein
VNALCDGVVSIALTVLALEIRLPEHGGEPLRGILAHMLPSVLAFLLSFTVIGGFWLAHHRLRVREGFDHRTLSGGDLKWFGRRCGGSWHARMRPS